MSVVEDYKHPKTWKDWVMRWVRCNILGEHQYHDATIKGPYCRFYGKYYRSLK